jgi:hypothetical protein
MNTALARTAGRRIASRLPVRCCSRRPDCCSVTSSRSPPPRLRTLSRALAASSCSVPRAVNRRTGVWCATVLWRFGHGWLVRLAARTVGARDWCTGVALHCESPWAFAVGRVRGCWRVREMCCGCGGGVARTSPRQLYCSQLAKAGRAPMCATGDASSYPNPFLFVPVRHPGAAPAGAAHGAFRVWWAAARFTARRPCASASSYVQPRTRGPPRPRSSFFLNKLFTTPQCDRANAGLLETLLSEDRQVSAAGPSIVFMCALVLVLAAFVVAGAGVGTGTPSL